MPVPVRVCLEKNSSGREFRSVGGNGERGGEVREVKNRF